MLTGFYLVGCATIAAV